MVSWGYVIWYKNTIFICGGDRDDLLTNVLSTFGDNTQTVAIHKVRKRSCNTLLKCQSLQYVTAKSSSKKTFQVVLDK